MGRAGLPGSSLAGSALALVHTVGGTFGPEVMVPAGHAVWVRQSEEISFLGKVTVAHVVTYFVVGAAAAAMLDYESVFAAPIVRDYMKDFGSVAVLIGPLVQVFRGLIIAAVLLPFRSALIPRYGWLRLWMLLIGIGILSTAAAAPSSVEGVICTRLPLWYHLIGLPEMLGQTLLFRIATALIARHPTGVLAALPPIFERLLRALVAASLAFAGYAVVSVLFALSAGAEIDPGESLTLKVQGLFIAPFLINGIIAFVATHGLTARARLVAALVSFSAGVVVIALYQAVVSGGTNLPYALIAPAVPAAILWVLMPRESRRSGPEPLADVR